METERAVGEAFLDTGVAVEIVEAVENIFFRGGGAEGAMLVEVLVIFLQRFQDRRCEFEPIAQVRRVIADFGVAEEGVYGAALGVAADDDVVHAEVDDGKFDGGGSGIGVAGGAGGGNDVADVFDDEQIAGFAVGDEFGEDARIRTGDEQGVRILADLRELAKELPIISELVVAEFMDAFDELLHLFLSQIFVFGAGFLGEFDFKFLERSFKFFVSNGEDLDGEEAGVSGRTDADCGDGDARGHLDNGK